MKTVPCTFGALFGAALTFFAPKEAWAQTVTVDLEEECQLIQGFGGMQHTVWQGGPLTSGQIDLAFGNGPRDLGLTILRILVLPNPSDWTNLVSNALAAQAEGALVFASPWNPPNGDAWREQRGSYFDSYANEERPKIYLHEADYAAHLNAF